MNLIIKNSEDFKKLYLITTDDEKVTEISDAVGITIIRNYEKESEYYTDGKKMFIKLCLREGFLVGGIDMVEEDKGRKGLYTIIHDSRKYKKRFTNFFFGPEEKNILVQENDNILVKVQNKKFPLNKFVDVLVKNHLSDRLFWVRKKAFIKKIILKILFFLSDDRYDFVGYYHKMHTRQENKISNQEEEKELKISEEPFFKYFKIYKNTLFVFCIISLFILIIIRKKGILLSEEFSFSNPILLLVFIIILFLLHYLSSFLHAKKKDKDGSIYKLHNSLFSSNLKLKI